MRAPRVQHRDDSARSRRAISSFAPLVRVDAAAVAGLDRLAAPARQLFSALRERPLRSITAASRHRGIPFPPASKGTDGLLRLDIVRELTGRRVNRVFAWDRRLVILSDGTELL